jgi:lipoyl(octanoyl) transferase 2
MTLAPILWHYFSTPLPYARTLAVMEQIHQLQLLQRRSSVHQDILLLLQHQPVYTAGRRQTEDSVHDERVRLTRLGADFVTTGRGGQLTYHGPGQIVGYPLLDLARTTPPMSVREYICRLQKTLQTYLSEAHGLTSVDSPHTGVFLDATSKVASIGVQVRHRLTTHGFAMNMTREPLRWFEQVVACGLQDVKAACIEIATQKRINVESEMPGLVNVFGREFGREMVQLGGGMDGELETAISDLEDYALSSRS